MSNQRLREITERIVDELTSAAMLFTALDVSNAVKIELPESRHRDIAPLVRDMFDRRGMGAYIQTMIDVMAKGSTPARAYLYHLPEQPTSMYDERMRNQLATPPTRQQRAAIAEQEAPVTPATVEVPVRVGKDGRARVPRQLLDNAGIRGDQVLVKTEPMKLEIVATGSTVATPLDALYALPDLFFSATPAGQPLGFEHPTLLHLPRSMTDMFGTDPKLVARIEGASVVVVPATVVN